MPVLYIQYSGKNVQFPQNEYLLLSRNQQLVDIIVNTYSRLKKKVVTLFESKVDRKMPELLP